MNYFPKSVITGSICHIIQAILAKVELIMAEHLSQYHRDLRQLQHMPDNVDLTTVKNDQEALGNNSHSF